MKKFDHAKVKDLRTANGMSVTMLAARCGVTEQSVRSWEQGTTFPQMRKLCALSEVLGVSVGEFFA